MHSFIQENLAPITASAMLVGMVLYVVYLNVSYSIEKKREAQLLSTEPIHRTCKLDTTLQDRESTARLVDATMKAGFGIAEVLLKAALSKPVENHS